MHTASLLDVESPAQDAAAYQYLLLGELRYLLEESAGNDETQHWLLAVLDRLLARLPRSSGELVNPAPAEPERWFGFLGAQSPEMQKLRRLRDRIAHRAPYQILANEIRGDLRSLFDRQSHETPPR